MSSLRKTENWLLVEWSSGGRDVVYVRSVLSPANKELKIGDVLTVNRQGEPQAATLVARARERIELDSRANEEAAGPSLKNEEEPEDFSASGSSWAPSDDGILSGDSDKVNNKKIKLERCKRQYMNRRNSSKRILTPCHRANAIIPKAMQESNCKNNNRKRSHKDICTNISINKSLPDSTKRNNAPKLKIGPQTVTIDVREIESIRNSFHILFGMIKTLKQSTKPNYIFKGEKDILQSTEEYPTSKPEETIIEATEEENLDYQNEEFNRSDDNVLITNKYDNTYNHNVKKQTASTVGAEEWVPIGSGKTLIHVDQFRKINWKSYTIATRSLLLAVFPRRILATHSLTGKRSPAFQNKPAKMCLDPKIISDVIMEIMDRFDVKENLVRSIITTKCADECKMWKTRTLKKKSTRGKIEVNVPPTESNFEERSLVI